MQYVKYKLLPAQVIKSLSFCGTLFTSLIVNMRESVSELIKVMFPVMLLMMMVTTTVNN